MGTASLSYIPVLHAGYLDFLAKSGASVHYVLGQELLDSLPDEFDYVKRKDAIRALPEEALVGALLTLFPDSYVHVAVPETFDIIRARYFDKVVMPDDDVSRFIGGRHLKGFPVEYVSAFLRWDRQAVARQESASVAAEYAVSSDELDRLFLVAASAKAARSADWWRQVGAVLVKDGTVIYAANNHHTPHPEAINAFGDPRSLFKRGVRMECSTAEHAEATIIAAAAREGVSLKGASLYATDFPCPQCARLIAYSGVKKCLFSGGYSVLDGAEEMRRQGVELVYVQLC
jgi:dCMP deaminase